MAMSPPSWALSSVSFPATSPLMTSVLFHSAVCSVLETTYFLMSLMHVAERLVGVLGPVRGPLVVEHAAHQTASAPAKPAPTAAPISSLKYGKCHLSGDSTTPSREMKKFDLILRIARVQ